MRAGAAQCYREPIRSYIGAFLHRIHSLGHATAWWFTRRRHFPSDEVYEQFISPVARLSKPYLPACANGAHIAYPFFVVYRHAPEGSTRTSSGLDYTRCERSMYRFGLETAQDVRTPRALGRFAPSAALPVPDYGIAAHRRGLLASPAILKQGSPSTDRKHLYDDWEHLVLSLLDVQALRFYITSVSSLPVCTLVETV